MKKLLDPQVKALFEVGFIRPIDFLLALSWIAVLVTAIVFSWVGRLTVLSALALIFAQVTITSVWITSMIYRTCYHVIMARSDINTMPEAAAKLAVTYQLNR